MPTRPIKIVVAVAVVLLPIACGSSQAGGPATVAASPAPSARGDAAAASASAVAIRTFQFQPTSLAVTAGTEVVWTNQDQIKHTVTAGRRGQPTNAFDSDVDGAGATARFTFATPGTYPYHCEIHGAMDAEIVVA